MISYDSDVDALLTARERVRRLEELTSRRKAVAVQLFEAKGLLSELGEELAKEERDVSQLEGGFTAFLAGIFGSREDRLAKVLAVRQRLEGQRSRVEWLNLDRVAVDEGLAELVSAREEYDALLEREERALVASGDLRGRKLAEIDDRLAETGADLREHREAHRAGRDALQGVGEVLQCLGSARSVSLWDMLAQGGFVDMVEHGHLLNADEAALRAQQLLDTFSRELVDIDIHVTRRLPEVDTRWFADMFFDNIVTDVIKHQRIVGTGEAVAEVAEWVKLMVDVLDTRCEELARQRDALTALRERVITG